jgi:predicted HNH restriction endonuclease
LGYSLDVHHIVPFRTFKGDWRKANELSNLITLCRNCHRKAEVSLT